MFVGIDDTDSTSGMCTTYLASVICRETGVIGMPSLVRLNPNIPFKTRGNAAIAFSTEDIECEKKTLSLVKRMSVLEDPRTNPGVVFLDSDSIPPGLVDFYGRAVSQLVTIEEAEKAAKSAGAKCHKMKNGRGIIGALAAIGFMGASTSDMTYELIAYRKNENLGKRRMLDAKSVIDMDKRLYPRVFDNIDSSGKRVLITPRGNDPIFCGIRGVSEEDVLNAWDQIKPLEQIDHYRVFKTNQATDAHLREKVISMIKPYDCVIVSGTVLKAPIMLAGGHLVFRLVDRTGQVDCATYRQSKGLRDVVSKLAEGDGVKVYGGIGKYPGTINIEKLDVLSLVNPPKQVRPVCCSKNMSSAGKNKGYKCKKCNKKISQKEVKVSHASRGIICGIYDVLPGSRRHLSKPVFLG